MLVGAFAVVVWRIGVLPAILIFVGPIIWWIDKPHTEIFTLSLLAVALTVLERFPGWALVMIGVAATQNPPIVLAMPILVAAGLLTHRPWARSRRTYVGLLVGAVIAALHPGYYLARVGALTPTAATGHTAFHVPDGPELGAFLWDPNIGLLWGYPALLPLAVLAFTLAAWRLGRDALSAGVLAVVPIAGLFVASFAQSRNVNHGGTFGMCRWVLWLVPLAVPLFDRWESARRPMASLITVGVLVSAAVSLSVAHPRFADHHDGGPSYAARVLWETFPTLDNPLVEVFTERLAGPEAGIIPVATTSCSKVLLVDGDAPSGCPVDRIPDRCQSRGALCYANRTGGRYSFASAPAPFDWPSGTSSSWRQQSTAAHGGAKSLCEVGTS